MKINFDTIIFKPDTFLQSTEASSLVTDSNKKPVISTFNINNKPQKNNFESVHNDLLSSIISATNNQFSKTLDSSNNNYELKDKLKYCSIKTKNIKNQKKSKPNPQIIAKLAKSQQQCKRKQCKMLATQQHQKRIAQQYSSPTHIPNINKQKNDYKSKSYHNSKISIPVYQRLHLIHKKRQFNHFDNLNKSLQLINKLTQQKNYTNPQYLKQYKSFYDRLGNQVAKKKFKLDLYNKTSLCLIDHKGITPFQPNISKSIKTHGMISNLKPKTMKNSLVLKKVSPKKYKCFDFLNSSVDSIQKSIEMVEKLQDRFVHRMCQIFNQNGVVKVKPQCIDQLSNIQFNIMFPFLRQIEEKQNQIILIDQFYDLLKNFYQELPMREKQALRHHQTRVKNFLKQSKQTFASKAQINKMFPDYHKRIEEYV